MDRHTPNRQPSGSRVSKLVSKYEANAIITNPNRSPPSAPATSSSSPPRKDSKDGKEEGKELSMKVLFDGNRNPDPPRITPKSVHGRLVVARTAPSPPPPVEQRPKPGPLTAAPEPESVPPSQLPRSTQSPQASNRDAFVISTEGPARRSEKSPAVTFPSPLYQSTHPDAGPSIASRPGRVPDDAPPYTEMDVAVTVGLEKTPTPAERVAIPLPTSPHDSRIQEDITPKRAVAPRRVSYASPEISVSARLVPLGSPRPLPIRASSNTTESSRSFKRPTIAKSQSLATISTLTSDIPAAKVFSRGAAPLHLPALDELLDNIPDANFTEVGPRDMSSVERSTWKTWVKGEHLKPSKWKFWQKNDTVSYMAAPVEDEEKNEKGKTEHRVESSTALFNLSSGIPSSRAVAPSVESVRKLKFLPMHLLPPNLTVMDLKLNKTTSAPLLTITDVLSTTIDAILGAEGSSYAVNIMNVEIFRDLIQMLGLIVGYRSSNGTDKYSHLRSVVFCKVPAVAGLDLVSAFGMALLWFGVFVAITYAALYEFYVMTGGWRGLRDKKTCAEYFGEGYDREENTNTKGGIIAKIRNSKAYCNIITFSLCTLYVPLSKICVGALVWTSDFWIVPNPYVSNDNPSPSVLGPEAKYRAPLDFCYTTTMRKSVGFFDHFNWAYVVLPIAAVTTVILAAWFPIRLWNTVQVTAPRVDPFTEVGRPRRSQDQEYDRLLDRDNGHFAYLYTGYRRQWAGFKAIYMAIKLATVIIDTVLRKDNCVLRHASRLHVDVIRQGTLVGLFSVFLLIQLYSQPYLIHTQNASDSVSRVGYVVISFIGLFVALQVHGKSALSGPVLMIVTVVVYTFNAYFSVIKTGIAQRFLKRFQKRLDFSIDLFSPHLDLSKHVMRRVWQESLATLLLMLPDYRMPARQKLIWGEANDLPPYLIGFKGTPGERLVENFKILREISLPNYVEGAYFGANGDATAIEVAEIQHAIASFFTGPDNYWKPVDAPSHAAVTTFFGRADVVPFPFTVHVTYDQGATTVNLTNLDELREYVRQNDSREIRQRRQVRLSLRALDGKEIVAPFVKATLPQSSRFKFRRSAQYNKIRGGHTYFRYGTLSIAHNSTIEWRKYNYSSGFEVKLRYRDGEEHDEDGTVSFGISLERDAHSLGLVDDFRMTPVLSRIFQDNKDLLSRSMLIIQDALDLHRRHFADEIMWKKQVMSYSFLLSVVGQDDSSSITLRDRILKQEQGELMRAFPDVARGSLVTIDERLKIIQRSRITQWWYTLFDDIWRRNADDVKMLSSRPEDFSPHYQTSICYRPMSRGQLELFLKSRQLGSADIQGKKGYFHSGLLNRIYFYLDQVAYEGTPQVIKIHVGDDGQDVPFRKLDDTISRHYESAATSTRRTLGGTLVKARTPSISSSITLTEQQQTQVGDDNKLKVVYEGEGSRFSKSSHGTGDGTDEGDPRIRFRDPFPFEHIYDETRHQAMDMLDRHGHLTHRHHHHLQQPQRQIGFVARQTVATIKDWLGLNPVSHERGVGVYFSLRDTEHGFELPRRGRKVDVDDDEERLRTP